MQLLAIKWLFLFIKVVVLNNRLIENYLLFIQNPKLIKTYYKIDKINRKF